MLAEGDILFLIAGDAVNVTKRVGQPLHEEMTVIPGQVVEEHRDGSRSFQPEVTLAVKGPSVLAGVMAMVTHLFQAHLFLVKLFPTRRNTHADFHEVFFAASSKIIGTGSLKVS